MPAELPHIGHEPRAIDAGSDATRARRPEGPADIAGDISLLDLFIEPLDRIRSAPVIRQSPHGDGQWSPYQFGRKNEALLLVAGNRNTRHDYRPAGIASIVAGQSPSVIAISIHLSAEVGPGQGRGCSRGAPACGRLLIIADVDDVRVRRLDHWKQFREPRRRRPALWSSGL